MAVQYIGVFLLACVATAAAAAANCGNPAVSPMGLYSQRIVNGQKAVPNSMPWIVRLGQNAAARPGVFSYSTWCGGVIIDENWILTAAHCVKGKDMTPGYPNKDSWIMAGTTNVPKGIQTQRFTVAQAIPHNKYNEQTVENDIALLKLAKPLTFSDSIQPACLFDESVHPDAPVAKNANNFLLTKDGLIQAVAAGWGKTRLGDSGTDDLMQRPAPILPSNRCKAISQTDKTLCLGMETENAVICQGDSGGPIIVAKKDSSAKLGYRWFIAGVNSVTSWNPNSRDAQVGDEVNCASRDVHGVMTDVAQFKSWIEKTTGKSFSSPAVRSAGAAPAENDE